MKTFIHALSTNSVRFLSPKIYRHVIGFWGCVSILLVLDYGKPMAYNYAYAYVAFANNRG